MMNKDIRVLPVLLVAIAVAMLGVAGSINWAEDEEEGELCYEETEIFFELNNTDGDLGIHSLIDGEAWKRLQMFDHNERRMLNVRVSGRLQRQGLTEFFFESAEPTFDELDPDDFFARFPAGEYEVEGLTLDGERIEGETELTHLMPAPPVTSVNGEDEAVQCDDEEPGYDAPELSAPITISWNDVVTSHPDLGSPRSSTDIELHNYQLVVETETEDGLEIVMSVILPPGVTSMKIPDEFIALGDGFKYEVLVREESFNQTATESCFDKE
jgi:hypothetical protein